MLTVTRDSASVGLGFSIHQMGPSQAQAHGEPRRPQKTVCRAPGTSPSLDAGSRRRSLPPRGGDKPQAAPGPRGRLLPKGAPAQVRRHDCGHRRVLTHLLPTAAPGTPRSCCWGARPAAKGIVRFVTSSGTLAPAVRASRGELGFSEG